MISIKWCIGRDCLLDLSIKVSPVMLDKATLIKFGIARIKDNHGIVPDAKVGEDMENLFHVALSW